MAKRYFRISNLASRPGKPGVFPVCDKTIRRWVAVGEFPPPVRIGGTDLWDGEAIAKLLREKEGQPS